MLSGPLSAQTNTSEAVAIPPRAAFKYHFLSLICVSRMTCISLKKENHFVFIHASFSLKIFHAENMQYERYRILLENSKKNSLFSGPLIMMLIEGGRQ